MQKTHILAILALGWTVSVLHADTILLKNDTEHRGRIIGSTPRAVHILTSGQKTLSIPHDKIAALTFSFADAITLMSGERLDCKIVKILGPDMLVVTPDATRRIPLLNIKQYRYNESENLTTAFLPTTGAEFNNNKMTVLAEWKKGWRIGLSGLLHIPPYVEWSDHFMSGEAFGAGVAAGATFTMNELLSLSLGLDLLLFDFTNLSGQDTQLSTTFFHAGLHFRLLREFIPWLQLQVGADAGLLSTSGEIILYSYRKIEIQNNLSFGTRPYAAFQFRVNPRIDAKIGGAYFIGKSATVDIPVACIETFNIDFTGLQFFIRADYIFKEKAR